MTVLTRHLSVTSAPSPTGIGSVFTINPIASALLQPQVMIKFQIEKQVSSEPNRAFLEMHNLSDAHANALDFRYDPYASVFGPRITITGGFFNQFGVPDVSQLYSGVVSQGLTTEEGPNRVTRIECLNVYYELMRRPVSYLAVEGTTKADAILAIIRNAGGIIEAGQDAAIRANLGGAVYDEDENIKGTLDSVLTKFSKGLQRRIVVYWDDAGVSFDPLGAIKAGRPVKLVSEQTGLIGIPKATTSGFEYETRLDGSYRIGDPVKITSRATGRFFAAQGGPQNIERINTTSVSKVIHSGDNREGPFKTSISTKFLDLLQQVTK